MKFAATILALALATTHGVLDEGDHNVQKKDASKGLRGSAVDSSLERAAVGRKLDFYPPTPCPEFAPRQADPTKCGVCYNGDPCNVYDGCEGGVGLCTLEATGIPPCDEETCRCCDGSLPNMMGECQFYETVCSFNPTQPCKTSEDCEGSSNLCEKQKDTPCDFRTITCCDGTEVRYTDKCQYEPGEGPCSFPPTPVPTDVPTPCTKKLDVCIAVDESGSVCSEPGNPQLCKPSEPCLGAPCQPDDNPAGCQFAEGCPNFNNIDPDDLYNSNVKKFVTEFINKLTDSEPVLDELRVGVVEFGTEANLTTTDTPSGLTTPALATTAVNNIAYSGGYTNLEQAIAECRETLSSSADRSEVILVVTDGVATTLGDGTEFCTTSDVPPKLECEGAAFEEAKAAKYEGITIATAFVLDTAGDGSTFLEKDIATSPELAVTDTAFPDAGELAKNILGSVDLCTSN